MSESLKDAIDEVSASAQQFPQGQPPHTYFLIDHPGAMVAAMLECQLSHQQEIVRAVDRFLPTLAWPLEEMSEGARKMLAIRIDWLCNHAREVLLSLPGCPDPWPTVEWALLELFPEQGLFEYAQGAAVWAKGALEKMQNDS